MILIDALITVAPLIGLYSQYSLIKERRHIGSFSIDIIGIVLISNILRIMFWFSKGFANNLLIQSFIVIAMAFALLDLCVSVGYKKNNSLTDFTHLEEEGFWRWSNLTPFVLFTAFFAFFMGILTFFFVHFEIKIYGEIIGLASVVVDCTMGLPQLVNNQKSRSVQGLSLLMIGTWFLGDFSKTIYFIVQTQPLQFIIGGAIQLFIDLLIVIQVMAFRQNYQTVKGNYDAQMQDQIQTSNGDTQPNMPIDQLVKNSIYKSNDSPMKFNSMSIQGI